MKKIKTVIALLLSVALLVSFLPNFLVMAETAEFAYAEVLGAQVGETVFSYDFSIDALPSQYTDGTNGNVWLTNSTALGQRALYFQYGNWSNEGRTIKFNVGKANFAARITVAVDNGLSNNQSGYFAVYSGSNDGSASNIKLGLPDRTAGEPYSGAVTIYNESAQYGFDTYSKVTPFTSNSGVETYTFEVYNFDGVSYYTQSDGTLIGASAHKSGISLDTTSYIKLTCGYAEAWVTDITVKSLTGEQQGPSEELPIFTYAETIGATVGDAVIDYDFSKNNPTINGTTWIQNSTALGKKALYFTYDTLDGNRHATFNIGKANFAARITIAVDNTINNSQSGVFRVYTNGAGGTASNIQIGLPDRTAGDPYPGAVTVYNESAQYKFDIYGNVTPFTANSGVETFTFEIYNYNGVAYYTTEDGILIGSAEHKSGVTLDETSAIKLNHGYGEVWVTDITVKELTEEIADVPPTETPEEVTAYKYADTIKATVGKDIFSYDFSTDNPTINGTTWIQNSAALGKKALFFTYDTNWNRHATFNVGKTNYVARITIAVDNGIANNQSGVFAASFKGNGGETASYIRIGLPDRTAGDPYPGSVIIYNQGAKYGFDIYGGVTPFTSSSTISTYTFEVYNWNGVTYYCQADGNFIAKYPHPSEISFENESTIKLSCDYGEVWVTDITVKELNPCVFNVNTVALSLKENEPIINFGLVLDNSLNDVLIDDNTEFGAVVTINDNSVVSNDTTVDTQGAIIWNFEKDASETHILNFKKEMAVTSDIFDKYVNVRLFIKNGDEYIYSPAVSYCPAKLADICYRSTVSAQEKESLETIFASSKLFHGKNSKKLTFTAFSDFHYKQGMYISSIADMNAIFDRANASGSSFVVSAGDMCNDFIGSPELVNAFKNNKYGITAVNVYGNHELESSGNSMEVVTATLTNATNVVWGTADGSYNSSIGYYYFDAEGFRIICTDTNYSFNKTSQIWEHNKTSSYGCPSGNTNANSLGPVQLEWLENLLLDAAEKDIPCIVVSHAAFNKEWSENSPDSATVQEIFKGVNEINPGTVMMQISGHAHDDKIATVEDVVYFRVNTTRNASWHEQVTNHYGEEDYFMMETYDTEGNFLGYENKLISSLSSANQTHFNAAPVSAVVTIDECGIICINGIDVGWLNDIEPDASLRDSSDEGPQIQNFANFDCINGHIWGEDYTIDGDVHYKECIHPECTITSVNENAYYGEHEFVNGECVCGKTEAPTYEKGDIDGNGSVNAADLALLKKVIAGLTPVDDEEVKNPDVDGEGGATPNAADLAALKKKIAGLE